MTGVSTTPNTQGSPTALVPVSRTWLWFVPLLVLAVLALGREAAQPVAAAWTDFRPLPMPVLVECERAEPMLIVPIFDVSGSVIDRGGADPKARSFTEFQAVIDELAAAPCTPDDRVGALIFADRTVEVPPTLVSSASVAKTTIRRPPANEIGGGTDMVEAFERARQIEQRYDDHSVVFVVLSDNQADDMTSTVAALAAIGSPVHAIALGDVDPGLDAHLDAAMHIDDLARGDIATALVELINEHRRP